MKLKNMLQSVLFKVRYGYILVYVLFMTLNKFIPFCDFVSDSVGAAIYSSLAIFGAALLVSDLFMGRNMFRVRFGGLWLIFFVVYALSVFYNIRFGWVDNAKTFVWMLIQIFLLMAADPERSLDKHKKYFRVIFDSYIVIWFVGVAVSLWQFVVQYYAHHVTNIGDVTPEGFVDGRLFGIFTDPNYGALCSIIALLLAVFQLKSETRKLPLKIFYWTTIILNLFYTILSGSRTAELVLLGLAVVVPVLWGLGKVYAKGTKWYIKVLRQGMVMVLCVALTVAGIKVLKTGLSYVPGVYNKIVTQLQNPPSPSVPDASDPSNTPDDNDGPVNMDRPDVVGSDDISNARFKIWADALKLFQVSPLLGTSPRNHLAFAESYFGQDMYIVQRGYSVHNGYLSLLVHTGILGAGIMALWIGCVAVYVLRYLIRRGKSQDAHYKPILCLTLVLFAIAVSAFPLMGIFFGNSIIEVMFWLIMGYTLYLIRISDGKDGEKDPLMYRISETLVGKLSKK